MAFNGQLRLNVSEVDPRFFQTLEFLPPKKIWNYRLKARTFTPQMNLSNMVWSLWSIFLQDNQACLYEAYALFYDTFSYLLSHIVSSFRAFFRKRWDFLLANESIYLIMVLLFLQTAQINIQMIHVIESSK